MPRLSNPLACSTTGAPSKPAVVFLHGLLGSARDWQPVLDDMSYDYYCLAIDLPGHGDSKTVDVSGFEDTCEVIYQAITSHINGAFTLVGYSLGARLGMYLSAFYASKFAQNGVSLTGLIVENGHPGLDESEREARWQNDEAWASRFEGEPMESVLQDWYQQPVFSSLNHEQRQSFVMARSDNLGTKVAGMLRATSLAKQPLLVEPLKAGGVPVAYICGENDRKFKALAAQTGWPIVEAKNAGHNIHAEQPALFCRLVRTLTNPYL